MRALQLERQYDPDRAACLRALRLLLYAPAAPAALPPANPQEATDKQSPPTSPALAA